MKTKLCPKCQEVITFLEDEDYRICPNCGETVNRYIDEKTKNK
jgi:predicted RNA-binding Zn-ribbon protein involved in translation (DUF1610 family)